MQSEAYIAYDTATGAIIRSGQAAPAMVDLQADDGEAVIRAEASDATHYVDLDTESVVERAAINPSVSTSTGQVTLSNLPDPCTIRWQKQSGEVTGGQATVTFDEPGQARLVIEREPTHVPHEITVTIP